MSKFKVGGRVEFNENIFKVIGVQGEYCQLDNDSLGWYHESDLVPAHIMWSGATTQIRGVINNGK